MRWGFVIVGSLTLAACDSSGTQPAGTQPLRAPSQEAAGNEVVLRAQGLVAGPEAFYFSAGRNEVEAAMTAILGEPVERSENAECGTGPMAFTQYSGGVIVNFQSGNLVGWNTSDAQGASRVAGDVQIGTTREGVAEVKSFAPVEGSTLGDEFALGDAMGGFFEGDQVVMLYAGAQCFFR